MVQVEDLWGYLFYSISMSLLSCLIPVIIHVGDTSTEGVV